MKTIRLIGTSSSSSLSRSCQGEQAAKSIHVCPRRHACKSVACNFLPNGVGIYSIIIPKDVEAEEADYHRMESRHTSKEENT